MINDNHSSAQWGIEQLSKLKHQTDWLNKFNAIVAGVINMNLMHMYQRVKLNFDSQNFAPGPINFMGLHNCCLGLKHMP